MHARSLCAKHQVLSEMIFDPCAFVASEAALQGNSCGASKRQSSIVQVPERHVPFSCVHRVALSFSIAHKASFNCCLIYPLGTVCGMDGDTFPGAELRTQEDAEPDSKSGAGSSCRNPNSSQGEARVLLSMRFHHILDEHKRAHLVMWGDQLHLSGFSKPGARG